MSLFAQVNANETVAKARTAKVNNGIKHAAKVLAESTLGSRCPNLLKGIESENKDAQYQAATMVQLLENTAEYVQHEQGINLMEAGLDGGNTNAVSLLSPGVTSLTPKVVDIVNRL